MIHERLFEGKARRKSTAQLRAETGLSVREIRAAIREERRQGHFILTEKRGAGGYWLWDGNDLEELKTFAASHQAAALDLLRTMGPFLLKLDQERRDRERMGAE